WRDGGELGDRQGIDRQSPQEHDDHRDDDRQCRPMEDGFEHIFIMIYSGPGSRSGRYSAWYFWLAMTSSGERKSYSTFLPSRTCRTPSRTILSFTSSPFLMTNMSSISYWSTISR